MQRLFLNDRKVIVSFSRFLYNIHQILYCGFGTENGLDLHKIKGPITLEFDFVWKTNVEKLQVEVM